MTTTTKCDGCGEQLDDSGPYPGHIITLEVARMPNLSGSALDIYVVPPYPLGTYHFCGPACLTKWLGVKHD